MRDLLHRLAFILFPAMLALGAAALAAWGWAAGLALAPVLALALVLLAAGLILLAAGLALAPRGLPAEALRRRLAAMQRRLARLEAASRQQKTQGASPRPEDTRSQTRTAADDPRPMTAAPGRQAAFHAAGASRAEGAHGKPGSSRAKPAGAPADHDAGSPCASSPAAAAGAPHHAPAQADGASAAAGAAAASRHVADGSGEASFSVRLSAHGGARPGPSPRQPGALSTGSAGTASASGGMPSPSAFAAGGRDPLAGYRLYMEPVVDMRAQATVLYRAAPALADAEGRIYLGRQAQLRAAHLGCAPQMDLRTLEEAACFLRRLRERGRMHTGVICPLSAASLATARFHEALAEMLRPQEIATALRMDISQADLARLDAAQTEGLAQLARRGVRMAISGATPERAGAEALRRLGFDHADMAAEAISASVERDGGRALGRIAGAGLEIIASGVDTARMAERLRPFLRLARGRAFSPPRRLRLGAETGAPATRGPSRAA